MTNVVGFLADLVIALFLVLAGSILAILIIGLLGAAIMFAIDEIRDRW